MKFDQQGGATIDPEALPQGAAVFVSLDALVPGRVAGADGRFLVPHGCGAPNLRINSLYSSSAGPLPTACAGKSYRLPGLVKVRAICFSLCGSWIVFLCHAQQSGLSAAPAARNRAQSPQCGNDSPTFASGNPLRDDVQFHRPGPLSISGRLCAQGSSGSAAESTEGPQLRRPVP